MKKWLLFLLSVCLLFPRAAGAGESRPAGWTVYAPSGGPVRNDLKNKKEFEKERKRLFSAYRKRLSPRRGELTSGRIVMDGYTMDIYMRKIGQPGPNGYPVYICLHGGGTDLQTQLEQFEVMKYYYSWEIRSGLCIVPRAIVTGGGEHYWPESFRFYDRIIEDAILFHNADPDRVYLLGFSSGGDGVYAVAPLIPDRLAAAEMCAGGPPHHQFKNMYSLPFRIRMGELDYAWDRNKSAARSDAVLNALHDRYGGYPHQTLIHIGGSHNEWNETSSGMSRVYTGPSVQQWLKGGKPAATTVNSRSVAWLKAYTRNPLPEKVVWDTGAYAAMRKTRGLYWLDRDGLLDRVTVVASYNKKDNSVSVEECDAEQGTLKILLNPDMLDVFSPVKVNIAGTQVTVRPAVSRKIMESTLEIRGDEKMIFTSEIDITFDAASRRITVQAAEDYAADYSAYDRDRLLFWNDDGVFFVDERLFGLTPAELGSLLGVSLPKTEYWPHWGDGLYWTWWDAGSGSSVIFMFHDGRSVLIYSEREGALTGSFEWAVRKVYTNVWGVLTNGGTLWYYSDNNPYDGKGHTVQHYQSVRYWFNRDWENGYARNNN